MLCSGQSTNRDIMDTWGLSIGPGQKLWEALRGSLMPTDKLRVCPDLTDLGMHPTRGAVARIG